LRSANRQSIRQINEAVVLGAIHDHGPISRTDIADLTNLSPATITGIMGKLIRQRLVREREAGRQCWSRSTAMPAASSGSS
jgi:DNA-binding MarR family transcriptional regulator